VSQVAALPEERVEPTLDIPERIEISPNVHALTGRLLDSSGAPIVASGLEFTVQASEGRSWRWTARREAATDDSGRFALEMEYGETTTHVAVEVRVGTWAGAATAARAQADLALGRGSIDLGDLTPVAIPAILDGVVRSRRGLPLSHAIVSGREVDSRGAGLLLATTDASGRFELHGFVESARVELTAKCAGFLECERVYAAVDQPGVALELDPAGGVYGQVLADASVPLDELSVALWTQNGAGLAARFSTGLAYDGRFELNGLPSATYGLRVSARLSNDTLFETGGIVVDNGYDVSGERDHVIDLRTRLRGIRLTVGDGASHQSIGSALVFSDDGEHLVTRFAPSGAATILTSAPRVDVAVRATGYVVGAFDDVHDGATLELERAPLVTLVLPDALELPPEGSGLYCTLDLQQPFEDFAALGAAHALAAARTCRRAPSVYFGSRRRASLAIEVPGRYRASFTGSAARRHRTDESTPLAPASDSRDIDVLRAGSTATAFVAPDLASYASWRAALR
jgi:hypothetical protein